MPGDAQSDTCVLLIGAHPVRNRDLLASKLGAEFELNTWVPDDGDNALVDRLKQAEAVVAMRWTSDMPPAPNMRLLQLPGAGYDGIDFTALPDQCDVSNVYEHEIGIAEYVVAAILERCIGLRSLDATFRKGSWQDSLIVAGPPHGELSGKTVGLVGYGHIGQAVAKRLQAFDTRTIAVTRRQREPDEGLEWVGTMDRLPELLEQSDFVVLACALSPDTHHLINTETLARMKPSAYLVNVARGPVVDEDALYAALTSDGLSGAALDVWYAYPSDEEPDIRPARNPFHELPNVTMTPHLAGYTDGLWERRISTIADNLRRFRAGEELRNPIEWVGFG